MALIRQTWTLTRKNLLIVLWRHFFSTTFRAFVLPVVFMFFISYAKNFFVPPSDFGVGSANPVKSLAQAFDAGSSYRDTVAFVNNGYTGGDIALVINSLAEEVRTNGKIAQIVSDDDGLLTTCPSSLQGTSRCFAGVTFNSSPNQGSGGIWNYTLHGDGSLGTKIFVNKDTNDQEIYVLPFQRAIDIAIANASGHALPVAADEFPYTIRTNEQRSQQITSIYQSTIINILGVVFFIAMVGVTYQLVGQMASERELGMSALIEAMMPNKRRWEAQLARLVSYHLAFDIIYLPGWLVMGVLVRALVFPNASWAIVIIYHVLAGFALASFSIFCASFFRRSQLSGITTTILSLILAIIAQVAVTSKGSTGAVIVLSLLFPPINYVFTIIYMAKFQQYLNPVDLAQRPPNSPWGFPGVVFWVFLIVQIVVFPVLGALVERIRFGTASTDRTISNEYEDNPVAVRLISFTKIYRPGWFTRTFLSCFGKRKSKEVVAVNNLSMNILQGQIFILLGANGSGKSTTLDAIAGLNTVESGSIEVDGRGGLGLCPQKNVLWGDLTSFEHVKIFNGLKATGKKATREENEELIAACDLAMKMRAKSKTLSGGQKRKLQLAMMFTGGSRVCCVDEVSSGIDPLARRKVWDILLRERGKRTILLTTHFLDEADVLSDHIAILSKGVLKDEGSAVELKHRFGGGYRVSVEDFAKYVPEPAFEHVPRFHDYDQTVYQLQDSAQTSRFVDSLQRHGYSEYKLQGPTVENVFLQLADELKDSFHNSGSPFDSPPNESTVDDVKGNNAPSISALADQAEKAQMQLLPGEGTGLLRQTWVLFRKRITVLRFNYMPYIVAILLPIVAAGLVTLFLTDFAPLGCSPEDQSSVSSITSLAAFLTPDFVYGPPNATLEAAIRYLYPDLGSNSIHAVDTITDFNNYIQANFANVTPGGFFLGDTPTFSYLADYDVSPSALVQNLLDQAQAGMQIATTYQYFASIWAPSAGKTLQLVLYFGLAMCAYPGFFALYVTGERRRNVRALHYSNGVRATPLWFAYIAFDFIAVLLVSVVVIAIFRGAWYGWYYPGYLFVVFFLYGLASVALSYSISLFASSQLAAFAFSAGSQAVMFLLYFIAYMCIVTYSPASEIQRNILIAHFTIALVTPSGNLLRSLLLTLNEFSIICDDHAVASYGGAMTVFGGPITYLLLQFLFLMVFVIWYDGGGRFNIVTFLHRNRHTLHDNEASADQDPEVFEEASRVEASSDALRVLHLTKTFGTNTAVDDITFGIPKSQCFALLGPNGAGKSTTISLIRGDARFSSKTSSIFVEDISLADHRVKARNHLGVCPQFDAMDMMTVREHLRFYARVRGVPDVDHNASEVMKAVGIAQYADRMALALSGGNKRKLSLAIALMGNPSVVLLDEPSSGMDAAAKRVMWRVLGSVREGRALLITTHSMEEADALAQRAGIMAGRMLALGTTEALRKRHGDALHVHLVHTGAPHTSKREMEGLRAWVGEMVPGAEVEERTYHGQLRFSVPNYAGAGEVASVVPGKGYDGYSSFAGNSRSPQIETSPRPIGASGLFALLEQYKEQLGIAYYSVSPTTLDQVFLNVVNKHNVQEENSRESQLRQRKGRKAGKGVVQSVVDMERGAAEEIA